MDEFKKERLAAAGICAEEALERFMGSESLFQRFLEKFPQDGNFSTLLAALEADDRQAALRASHNLKGMCGNLSMTVLYNLFSRQVALMRNDEWNQAKELMPEITAAYNAAVKAILE